MADNARLFLESLWTGQAERHGVIIDPGCPGLEWSSGDFLCSERPLPDWADLFERIYLHRVRAHELAQDDAVPHCSLFSGTGLFAAAFGAPMHRMEESLAHALPAIQSVEELQTLCHPTPDTAPLDRVWKLGRLLRDRLGPDAPIGVPDIQSPFDIAALVWRKESFFRALIEEPHAVADLVDRCGELLEGFLERFLRELAPVSLAHCPYAWAPPELGCWLSEDEAGSLSRAMFERFCLPWLQRLSHRFGGLFMHCCASADHQYPEFLKIPNLRGLNRVWQSPGPGPAIDAFSGHTVLIQAWEPVDSIARYRSLERPDTRFLFVLGVADLAEAAAMADRARNAIG